MGSNKLFHKRQAKAASDLQRRQAARKAYPKILIVCEGAKTEPNYFREVVDHYELSTANVTISGEGGSAPKKVFEHGIKLFQQEKKNYPQNSFDRVYFVFDKEQHETYQATLDKIKVSKPQNTFFAITSIPCFEFWLLLHFEYTTQPFKQIGKTSSGKALLSALQKHLPNYKKNSNGIFRCLFPRLGSAMQNAKLVNAHAQREKSDNPSTQIHVLLEFMQNMKN